MQSLPNRGCKLWNSHHNVPELLTNVYAIQLEQRILVEALHHDYADGAVHDWNYPHRQCSHHGLPFPHLDDVGQYLVAVVVCSAFLRILRGYVSQV